ncbi:hypothetical protein Cgig2_020048 [Carnegiea gigantea]|uniref:SET domain-containing protein n=1 Tax=Carnegiea gigantea TaxID=171969 RepID=A0A9Q1JEY3_9CARY|nr:hypothetical protein Cgig2_020048 [Carnegiea gigantea]
MFSVASYNRIGKDADEADIEEIIDMASKAPLADQQTQVQENIHSQTRTFCQLMDEILLPIKNFDEPHEPGAQVNSAKHRSGLSLAVGSAGHVPSNRPDKKISDQISVQSLKFALKGGFVKVMKLYDWAIFSAAVPETKPLKLVHVSQAVKDHVGYSLAIRPSEIPHKDAGQGLFLEGEAEVGSVIAIYPGVIYSPAYYRYIPGYPRVDAHNSYLITRYDGTVINAQPWGRGDDKREYWEGMSYSEVNPSTEQVIGNGSYRIWKMLSKPLESDKSGTSGEILERRHPLAFAHFANHPPKGTLPNVMVCPYDFPLDERGMRTYIPNISFGSEGAVKMRRFGSFWFKTGKSSVHSASNSPILKSLVLVANRAICNEEILLNYRLSNSKRCPSWYVPVDEEEDRRRWG